jgi:hypothetical protein
MTRSNGKATLNGRKQHLTKEHHTIDFTPELIFPVKMMRNMAADDYDSSGASDGIDCTDSEDADVTYFSGSSALHPAALGSFHEVQQEWPCWDCHSFHPAAYQGCPISFRRRKQAEDTQGAPNLVKEHAGSRTPLTVFSYWTASSQSVISSPICR